MISLEEQKEIAVHLVKNIAAGGIEEKYLAPDLTAWTILTGSLEKEDWQGKLRRSVHVWTQPLQMTIDSITAEPGRVVVQSRSKGLLITGEEYSNTYMFLVEFNDEGRIRHVREYFNIPRLEALYRPAVQQWEAQQAANA